MSTDQMETSDQEKDCREIQFYQRKVKVERQILLIERGSLQKDNGSESKAKALKNAKHS